VTVTGPNGFNQVTPNITGTSYMQDGLVNGLQYSFTVKAVNSAGPSGSSNTVKATPSCTPLTAPTGLTAMAGHAQAPLRRNALAGATGYNIRRDVVANPGVVVAAPYTNLYTDTALTPGTSYHYAVTATGSCGESPASSEVTVVPAAVTSNNATLVAADMDA